MLDFSEKSMVLGDKDLLFRFRLFLHTLLFTMANIFKNHEEAEQ